MSVSLILSLFQLGDLKSTINFIISYLILKDGTVLIFLNPQSGQKQSMSIFEKTLKPLLDEFALSYELFVTKRAKEAEDYLQSVENLLAKYSAIVIVSGDGLLFEVLQGLFQRHIVTFLPKILSKSSFSWI